MVRPRSNEAGWMVVRYKADFPAVTFLHWLVAHLFSEPNLTFFNLASHVNAHNFGGMAVALLEGVDKLPPIPQLYHDYEEDSASYQHDST